MLARYPCKAGFTVVQVRELAVKVVGKEAGQGDPEALRVLSLLGPPKRLLYGPLWALFLMGEIPHVRCF